MTRVWCWFMAALSTVGAMFAADRPITASVCGVVAVAWLRAAAREAARDSWRQRWL